MSHPKLERGYLLPAVLAVLLIGGLLVGRIYVSTERIFRQIGFELSSQRALAKVGGRLVEVMNSPTVRPTAFWCRRALEPLMKNLTYVQTYCLAHTDITTRQFVGVYSAFGSLDARRQPIFDLSFVRGVGPSQTCEQTGLAFGLVSGPAEISSAHWCSRFEAPAIIGNVRSIDDLSLPRSGYNQIMQVQLVSGAIELGGSLLVDRPTLIVAGGAVKLGSLRSYSASQVRVLIVSASGSVEIGAVSPNVIVNVFAYYNVNLPRNYYPTERYLPLALFGNEVMAIKE